MTQGICEKLREIEKELFSLRETNGLGEISDRVSSISTQIRVQKHLIETVQLLRERKSLPVRRIGMNLKKLCDGTDESRWRKLQGLSFAALIFCTASFTGLPSLPIEQFTWLVDNVDPYLEAQDLSPSWISIDQVSKIIAKIPRAENTKKFLASM